MAGYNRTRMETRPKADRTAPDGAGHGSSNQTGIRRGVALILTHDRQSIDAHEKAMASDERFLRPLAELVSVKRQRLAREARTELMPEGLFD